MLPQLASTTVYNLATALGVASQRIYTGTANNPVTILQAIVQSEGSTGANDTFILCGTTNIIVFTNSGSRRADTLGIKYECKDVVDLVNINYSPPLSYNSWAQITLIPTVNAMASTTYTEVCGSTSTGQNICYDPLKAQIGLFLWAIAFMMAVYFIYKVFKRI